MRIGHGYDVHRFAQGRKLVLCGVLVPASRGLAGHSDADVALHAVMDAILGAMAKGDIGGLFPDTDPRYQDIDSRVLLARVVEIMAGEGLRVGNLDVTIVAQAPKLAPHIAAMRGSLCGLLGCGAGQVNVKATTEEGLGFTGRGEGMACHAVVLLEDPEGAVDRRGAK